MPGHIEGALALARAALDAQQFGKARAALAAYLGTPTRRIALLMAELERAEHSDEGRAREWLARALHAAPDPAWTADGHVSDRWLPVSPVTGRLDAFDWRVPLTGILSAPVIEPEPAAVLPVRRGWRVELRHSGRNRGPWRNPPRHHRVAAVLRLSPKAEAVIPLIHAPDDPGPDAAEESEAPAVPETRGWPKLL